MFRVLLALMPFSFVNPAPVVSCLTFYESNFHLCEAPHRMRKIRRILCALYQNKHTSFFLELGVHTLATTIRTNRVSPSVFRWCALKNDDEKQTKIYLDVQQSYSTCTMAQSTSQRRRRESEREKR